jgi:hypothetical protein
MTCPAAKDKSVECVAGKHIVKWTGRTITIRDRKTNEVRGERKYESIHAARCAYGRVQTDKMFSPTLLAAIQIHAIKGKGRKKVKDSRPRVDMCMLLAVALHKAAISDSSWSSVQNTNKQATLPQFKKACKELVKECTKMLSRGSASILYTGHLRQVVNEINTELEADTTEKPTEA